MKSKIQKWNFSENTTMKNIQDNVCHVPYVNWFILKFLKLLFDSWWCDFWIIFMKTSTNFTIKSLQLDIIINIICATSITRQFVKYSHGKFRSVYYHSISNSKHLLSSSFQCSSTCTQTITCHNNNDGPFWAHKNSSQVTEGKLAKSPLKVHK